MKGMSLRDARDAIGSFRTAPVLLLVMVLAVSCSGPDQGGGAESAVGASGPGEPPAAAPWPVASVSAPFDLASIVRQVHFAFRPLGSGWVGGHQSYAVEASQSGFSVAPSDGRAGAPARFETTAIGRGRRITAPPGIGRVAQDGHLTLSRGDVTEHLRNGEDGVEQSFAFGKAPRGDGDLEVRVRVTGQDYVGQTQGGQHFMDPTSGLGVRYGAATWVDAHGERTPIAVRWADGELVLAVPAAIVDGSAYPALLDPTVGPEIEVDMPPFGGAGYEQSQAAVGTNGTDYLVAWHDERPTGACQTFATRVTSAGVVLDPSGFALGSVYPTTTVDLSPAIGFDGTNYLVVWGNVVSGTVSKGVLMGARVQPDGVVLDPGAGITIASIAASYMDTPRLAFDGTNYLVVWAYGGIHGARVSKAGTVLSAAGGFSIASGQVLSPSVAFDGTNFLVVWQDRRSGTSYDIYGARVSKTGTVVDTAGVPIAVAAGDQLHPSVAFDGTNHFVVWEDRKGATPDIYGARVTPATTVLDPAGLPIAALPTAQHIPEVVRNGASLLVAWCDGSCYVGAGDGKVLAARVLGDGTVLDPTGVVVAATGAALAPKLACGTAQCLLAWDGYNNGPFTPTHDIYAARFAGGAVLDTTPLHLTPATSEEVTPAVAFDGTNYLVVWSDNRKTGTVGSLNVFGARVSPQGTMLDPSGIAISQPSNGANDTVPRVTWMSPYYLVVWQKQVGNPDIYGARVAADGTVLDPASFVISSTTNNDVAPDVAADGTNYMVVWTTLAQTKGARVSPAGVVLDSAGISILSFTGSTGPTIAYDGTRYLVVTGNYPPRANRVTPAGTVLNGTSGITLAYCTSPRVAYDGTNFVVVGSQNYDVVASRVSGAGTVLDPVGVALSAGGVNDPRDQPTIGCDGQKCLVLWRDKRSTTRYDVYGSFIDSFLTVLNPSGLLVSANGQGDAAPAAATDGAGRWLAVYQQNALYPGFGSQRILARTIVSLPQGQACSQAGDCASGYCVDGYCCNAACGSGKTDDCVACSVAAGAAANGTCAPLTGGSCNDGDACTTGEACQAGLCAGGAPITCTPADDCHLAGTCNPATGTCSTPTAPDGAPCNDDNACTQTDACQSGSCQGNNPAVCAALDQCHGVGTCNPGTGLCDDPALADGAACDDGNGATVNDACLNGACVGNNLCAGVTCMPLDACHAAGTCDPVTGLCDSPALPDGTACDDGNAATVNDACLNGACVGNDLCAGVTCMPLDACHAAGTCDPVTGLCDSPALPDGAACDDGDLCSTGDACQSGVCSGVTVACAPIDECHLAGACVAATGTCTTPPAPAGTPCSNGTCDDAGTCSTGTGGAGTGGAGIGGAGTGGTGTGGTGTGGTGIGGAGTGGTDGGTTTSGSTTGAGPGGSSGGGCGCRVAERGSSSAAPAVLLALAALARRRRSRRSD